MTGAEKNFGKGKELSGEEEDAVDQREEQRLSEVTERIVMDEEAKRRVLEGIKARKYRRRRLVVRVPAAAIAVCLALFVLWLGTPEFTGDELVVYAATEENGWQRLEEGERILLKMEPFQTIEREGFEAFDENGRPYYYPYICTFRVAVSEDYLYDRQMVMIGDDHIMWEGDKLVWWVAPERPEAEDKVRQGAFRLWIVSDNIVKNMRERVGAYEVELTKEDGKCYAELKRVWKRWEK